MKLYFCTLFNSNYLSRGLVMYDSLVKHCTDFELYVFAFDDASYQFLKDRDYPKMTVISLNEFEDEDLLRIKPSRTAGEYCWTCSSSTILYCIEKFKLDHCTYIDADMVFYSDPRVLIEEMKGSSVLITEHRYSKEYDQSVISGIYCVQFITFLNDECGMKALRWWRNSCIDWCYNRIEDGKFGDQKYLDEFTSRFEGVHVMKNHGGGIAPWNVQQYNFRKTEKKIFCIEKSSRKEFEVVFFHFHGVKFYANNIVALSGDIYELSTDIRSIFYFPYISALIKSGTINRESISFDPHGKSGQSKFGPLNFLMYLKYYINDLKFSWKNIFGRNMNRRITHHHFYKVDSFK